jgi:hypothetical protein
MVARDWGQWGEMTLVGALFSFGVIMVFWSWRAMLGAQPVSYKMSWIVVKLPDSTYANFTTIFKK